MTKPDVWTEVLNDESDWMWWIIHGREGHKYCIGYADCSLFDN